MPLIAYTPKKFNAEHTQIVARANTVLDEYARQGYDLTLRQLYYQFVARGWLANNDRNYKRLGTIISDARRAGLIDWDRIVDRTRYLREVSSWDGPADIVEACAEQFKLDRWAGQQYRPEVWIEKDALVGVLEVACRRWRVPYFSCRGYVSDSEAWSAGRRLRQVVKRGQMPVVFHLGDHDPSGVDMSRDIQDRINLFSGSDEIEVRRIALTMAQVEEVNPPPNPAKQTDARFASYSNQYGEDSWELDALDPDYISNLIAEHVGGLIDQTAWDESEARENEARDRLRVAAAEIRDTWEG